MRSTTRRMTPEPGEEIGTKAQGDPDEQRPAPWRPAPGTGGPNHGEVMRHHPPFRRPLGTTCRWSRSTRAPSRKASRAAGMAPWRMRALLLELHALINEVPQSAQADHGGQHRPADGVDRGHAQPADDGGHGQGQFHPEQPLERAHAAAPGRLFILRRPPPAAR